MAIANKHPGFSENDKERLYQKYVVEEKSLLQISSEERCSLVNLRQFLVDVGITIRNKKQKTKQFYNAMEQHWTLEERRRMSKRSPVKKKTQEVVVMEFKQVHGDRYDYSQVEYVGCFDKVAIKCKDHGLFYQLPSNHKNGTGCPICANNDLMGGYNLSHFEQNPSYKQTETSVDICN